MYIYESHTGGLYCSDNRLDSDVLYCEICWDYDQYIGQANSKKEFLKLINVDEWNPEYIEEFIEEYFEA